MRSRQVVKLHAEMKVGAETYPPGSDLPWAKVYPFFFIHMLMFGGSGFLLAYGDRNPSIGFLFLHGGFAILIYLIFYLAIFGRDEVKWMFINAGLGLFGIIAQIDWILSLFGSAVEDFAWYVHIIPFLYYVMYTFLLHQAVLDAMGARDDGESGRAGHVNLLYVVISLVAYTLMYLY